MKQPNVLLIFTDQQRSDSLGCYGFNAISTPHLDRLAKEGALFETLLQRFQCLPKFVRVVSVVCKNTF